MPPEDAISPEPASGAIELPADYQQALQSLDSQTPTTAALPESAADVGSSSPATAVPAAAPTANAAPVNREDADRAEPASWAPDERTRETAGRYGLSDEDLRSFGSAENFALWRAQTDRVMLAMSQRRAAQAAQQPAPTQ